MPFGNGFALNSSRLINPTAFFIRISVEFARGTPHGRDKDRFGGGSRYGRDRTPPRGGGRGERRPSWMDKYGAPERTDYKLIVENLSSRVSWQVSLRNIGDSFHILLCFMVGLGVPL